MAVPLMPVLSSGMGCSLKVGRGGVTIYLKEVSVRARKHTMMICNEVLESWWLAMQEAEQGKSTEVEVSQGETN